MNRHVKTALAVAPLLGIGGYILADYFKTPKEEQQRILEARQHRSYELAVDPRCIISERGGCALVKDDLRLTFSVSSGRYWLESNQILNGITMTLAQDRSETRGLRMLAHEGRRKWSTRIRELTEMDKQESLMIRLVVNRGDSYYYAAMPVDASSLVNN
ncbi:MAG TPA: hypothetical protein DDW55_01765 [Gammaproteobacteria bacterium]|nr:hypothetical protein [Gammaproteobacteria bacterium]